MILKLQKSMENNVTEMANIFYYLNARKHKLIRYC